MTAQGERYSSAPRQTTREKEYTFLKHRLPSWPPPFSKNKTAHNNIWRWGKERIWRFRTGLGTLVVFPMGGQAGETMKLLPKTAEMVVVIVVRSV